MQYLGITHTRTRAHAHTQTHTCAYTYTHIKAKGLNPTIERILQATRVALELRTKSSAQGSGVRGIRPGSPLTPPLPPLSKQPPCMTCFVQAERSRDKLHKRTWQNVLPYQRESSNWKPTHACAHTARIHGALGTQHTRARAFTRMHTHACAQTQSWCMLARSVLVQKPLVEISSEAPSSANQCVQLLSLPPPPLS